MARRRGSSLPPQARRSKTPRLVLQTLTKLATLKDGAAGLATAAVGPASTATSKVMRGKQLFMDVLVRIWRLGTYTSYLYRHPFAALG